MLSLSEKGTWECIYLRGPALPAVTPPLPAAAVGLRVQSCLCIFIWDFCLFPPMHLSWLNDWLLAVWMITPLSLLSAESAGAPERIIRTRHSSFHLDLWGTDSLSAIPLKLKNLSQCQRVGLNAKALLLKSCSSSFSHCKQKKTTKIQLFIIIYVAMD